MTTDFLPFSWDPSGSLVTTGVSSLELKNSTGHVLNMKDIKSPISIKIQNNQDLINKSQRHYVGTNRTVYHKVDVTSTGMTLRIKVRPESTSTYFSVFVKYQKRPSPTNNDYNTTIPNFSSCVQASFGYTNCSRDPYAVYLGSGRVNRTGYYFIGVQVKSRILGMSRVRRCLGQGRSKRSCVEYKEAPTTAATYNKPEYRHGDQNYTMEVLQAACLYWSTELSKWTSKGCTVRTLKLLTVSQFKTKIFFEI